jgi:CPA1 family monovalent cation:H+ antiporter
VVATRFAWFFTVPCLIRGGRPAPHPGARQPLASAWSWRQGTVSLAVALALPPTTTRGGAFPQRNLIMSLTLAVIFVTFAGQGLALPALIRRPDLGDGGADSGEETRARRRRRQGRTLPGRLARTRGPGGRAGSRTAARLLPVPQTPPRRPHRPGR